MLPLVFNVLPLAPAKPAPAPDLPSISDLTNTVARVCSGGSGGDVLCPLFRSFLPENIAPLATWLVIIILTMIAAIVLRNLVRKLIIRATRRAAEGVIPERLRQRGGAALDDGALLLNERRRQRADTLGSVLSHIANIVIIGTAVLMILSQFGVELAPLLTSVGILGVAVGFGAQELVKDFIAGMFMLLEDQYGVGDVIDVGPAVGTVEAVTLRVTRLRDVDGRVWYVRNGTITRIGNESQGWSRASLDVPVAYDSDIPAVREILNRVATELWEDTDYRDRVIVEEPQVWGLEQISDTAVIFRISAKTLPARQAEIARELRMRVKAALDRESIPFVSTA
ncbi:mechanosensitive ion channel family protein [Spongiactinospora sp. TRM90649]|uniref:mechanosensitive ion channel family protein n=1 Tax=Spongiactinospora sp. TRM90649 TaxID=3031114 RepID=UPI0023F95C2A|nr:mechanosensitive ion channel family protein [Spongiactinospora sp. TRM90649]MDF5758756.1 mechanosensitive ion channel family protein [Spongiactinospora sp. TRM90649]